MKGSMIVFFVLGCGRPPSSVADGKPTVAPATRALADAVPPDVVVVAPILDAGPPADAGPPDAFTVENLGLYFASWTKDEVAAGMYRVRGSWSQSLLETRERSSSEYARWTAELTFAADGTFEACLIGTRETASSRYTKDGVERNEDVDTLQEWLLGTYVDDGFMATATITRRAPRCDNHDDPTIADLATFSCVGMTHANEPRLVGCLVSGSWGQTISKFTAPPIGPSGARWLVAGDGNGIELGVSDRAKWESESPDIEVKIEAASSPIQMMRL